jgi:hypothetical protein
VAEQMGDAVGPGVEIAVGDDLTGTAHDDGRRGG